MNSINIVGTQEFMGKTIPIVVGGFGPDTRCVCDKTLAEIHATTEREIRKLIARKEQFLQETVDFVDLKNPDYGITTCLDLLSQLGYSKQMMLQAQHIYLVSASGYCKLAQCMSADSRKISRRFQDEYFQAQVGSESPMTDERNVSTEKSAKNEQKAGENMETENRIAISVVGRQPFMNTEIPVVLGGFGPGAKCICDKTIAELHQTKLVHVRELINRNKSRFFTGVDCIDLAQEVGKPPIQDDTLDLLTTLGYVQQSITQAEHIYILSESGYFKLIKIMDTDLAWDVYNQLLHDYFLLREMHQQISPFANVNMQQFSPEIQFMKSLVEQLMKAEIQRQQQDQKIAEIAQKTDIATQKVETVNQQMEDMRQVIAISPTEWRKETKDLIAKIAQARGNDYPGTYQKIFNLVEQRAGVSLGTRLNNKRRRMAELGVDATKCKSVTRIDVIADDKKLVEIYIAIVKEVAIRYGIGANK